MIFFFLITWENTEILFIIGLEIAVVSGQMWTFFLLILRASEIYGEVHCLLLFWRKSYRVEKGEISYCSDEMKKSKLWGETSEIINLNSALFRPLEKYQKPFYVQTIRNLRTSLLFSLNTFQSPNSLAAEIRQ